MKQIIMYYLVSFVLYSVTFIGFNLGMDHINFNEGIHPLIAFPLAVVAIFAAICCFNKAQHLRERHLYKNKR